MKELGERSAEFHRRVGERASALGIDRLWVLAGAPAAQAIVEGATGIESECFLTHRDLIGGIQRELAGGDRLLFKASNSVGLNRVVAAVLEHLQPAKTSR
jgi:UDP-N-acetylmuramoyl-tripeptide--D-alanyl-D-alanine ligase